MPLVTSEPDDANSNQKHFQSLVLQLKHEIKSLKSVIGRPAFRFTVTILAFTIIKTFHYDGTGV